MQRLVIWLLAALLTGALTVLAFCPASWLASAVEAQTAGRLTLGDAQGTLWNGSAFIGGAPSGKDPVTPLLPGRFAWHLSPMALFGRVDAELENPDALSGKVGVQGTWNEWLVSTGSILLPTEGLSGLGAPLNTVGPSGRMRLSWQPLTLVRQQQRVDLHGQMTLDLEDIASRLSSIKPLGSYRMALDWQGQTAQVMMKTVKGPLLLSGAGKVEGGHLQFSGKAEAAQGQEETLANLLNMLGQRRKEGDKTIIALEFK